MLTIPFRRGSLCGKKMGFEDEKYLSRIKKSLYYVNLPEAYCTSLPCTEFAAEIFSEINKFSLDQLDIEEAANLSHNACVSPCSLVLALVYVDRLKLINPKYLNKVSPSELFLISLMVGSKFLQDDGEEDEVNNYEWAASAGINVQDINRAEKQFLDAIRWEVFVSEEEFWDRFHVLECKLGFRQGCRRGWFTYTELNFLLGLIDITSVIQTFCSVTTAFLTSYTASMLTLVGSAILVGQITGLALTPRAQEIDNNVDWNNISSDLNFTNDIYMKEKITMNTSVTPNNFKNSHQPTKLNPSHEACSDFDYGKDTDCTRGNPILFFKSCSRTRNMYTLRHHAQENYLKIFVKYSCFWKWTEIIRNYLLLNSVPRVIAMSITNLNV